MKGHKGFIISIQVLSCMLFMSFPLLFINNGGNLSLLLLRNANYWLFCFSFIGLYYLNAYLLIPKLLIEKKYFLYSIILFVLLLFFYQLKPFDRLMRENMAHSQFTTHAIPPLPPPESGHKPPPPANRHMRIDVVTIYIFVMVIALSTASRMIGVWTNTEQRIIQTEKDKVQAELAFLKAQVHPHFLFNTLNNIYTLALTGHHHTAESIYKLAQIMRYITEQAQEQSVPLQLEVNCIKDYIALQQLRLSSNSAIDVNMEKIDPAIRIAPLLFMTFIENIFKYGVSKNQPSPIKVHLSTENGKITFITKNRIHAHMDVPSSSGIGIANTKKRLEQLYPTSYLLEIQEENQWFNVHLQINVS